METKGGDRESVLHIHMYIHICTYIYTNTCICIYTCCIHICVDRERGRERERERERERGRERGRGRERERERASPLMRSSTALSHLPQQKKVKAWTIGRLFSTSCACPLALDVLNSQSSPMLCYHILHVAIVIVSVSLDSLGSLWFEV